MSFLKNLKKKEIISEASYSELFTFLGLHQNVDLELNNLFKTKLVGRYSSGYARLTSMDAIHKKCWFINSGMVIGVIYSRKRESTLLIFKAGELAILPNSFFLNQLPNCYFIACPETHLLEINNEDLRDIFAKHPENIDLTDVFHSSNTTNFMEKSILVQSPAKERIVAFHRLYPDTSGANRKVKLSDSYQASYLDLDPSTFCRQQKELYSEKSNV